MPTSTAARTTRACSPAAQPADLDRDVQRIVWPHRRRQIHRHIERALGAIDREPLDADGAARHALGRLVERAAQGGDDIGTRPPILADRHRHLHGAGRGHILRLALHQPVGEHIERETAGAARGHRDIHGVPGRVARLVERDLEKVGRIRARTLRRNPASNVSEVTAPFGSASDTSRR